MDYTIVIIPVGIVCLAFIGLYFLLQSANKIFRALDDIEKRAKECNNKAGLTDLFEELKKISSKTWHHSMHSRVREISVLLHTKYEMLNAAV